MTAAGAQPFSYVYIQGDMKTPFYVKLDGKMQPRYGKNHCIIPDLATGEIEIELLFQQHIYPSQKFTVNVPENSAAGFLLEQQEKGFALYDIQRKEYIQSNQRN